MNVLKKTRLPDPHDIGDMQIILTYRKQLGIMAAHVGLDVLDISGYVIENKQGDLQPYLTEPQKTSISGFLVDMRQLAYDKLVGN